MTTPSDTFSLPDLIRGDVRQLARNRRGTLRKWLFAISNRGMQAIFLYRLAHWCWRNRMTAVSMILCRVAQHLYAIDIAYQAVIGPGLVIVHGFGIVIGSAAKIGSNCCIFHGVTLGDRGTEWVASGTKDGHPVVGNSCMFGAGAKILGPVLIGNNCVIGANAVVLKSLPDNSIAAGVPASVVGQRPPMDENLRPLGSRPSNTEEHGTAVLDQTDEPAEINTNPGP